MTGRSAIVTGSSAGIGLAVSAMLANDGWAVTMVARREPRLTAAAEPLRATGAAIDTRAFDMTAEGAAADVVATHVERFGGLDLVVANAGWGNAGSVADGPVRDLERMLRTNVTATFALAQAAVPVMRRTGAPAWFVITSSISGEWPTAGFAGYGASKAAAVSLARSIATEEADTGVRACAICPAFVATDMTAWLGDTVPVDALLDAADVAESVRYLLRLSPAASVTELVLRRAAAPDQHAP